ncbi:MAG: metallopeptidase TldD-related protein [Phycisphaerae bacterium]
MIETLQNIAEKIVSLTQGQEVMLVNFSAEKSDFVRLNHNQIRQAGQVRQIYASIELIDSGRHLSGQITLSGQAEQDLARAKACLRNLREHLGQMPEDPYLLYNQDVQSGSQIGQDELPAASEMLEQIQSRCEGSDMVGLLAAGGIYAGFANSLGQRNWFSTHTFHFDWCFYHQADKAVKCSYGGFQWDPQALAGKVETGLAQLEVLRRPARKIDRGQYRVYLTPAALEEFVGMLGWGGFGLKAHQTKTTSLLKMAEDGVTLDPRVSLVENTAGGLAPNFQSAGYVKPDSVTLIDSGRLGDLLISPRSARQYDAKTNGAGPGESPSSLEMAAGQLADDKILHDLGTGLYINTLHYANYSDRPACRITGMTRFATFWVESGEIVAPVEVMRFDETVYNVLGEGLVDLTRSRQFMPAAGTYGQRSTDSTHLPGALVDGFTFTL